MRYVCDRCGAEISPIMIECPLCGELHPVDRRIRTATVTIKGEKIKYQEEYYVCGENEYVPAKVMDANLLAARDAYRSAHQTFTTTSTDGQAEVKLAPVRHGKWVIEDKHADYRTERRSMCGWVANRSYIQDKWFYCPNCGAKMDAKEVEE